MFQLPDYRTPELAPINPESRQNCNCPFFNLFIPFIHLTIPFSSSFPSSRSVTNAVSTSEPTTSPDLTSSAFARATRLVSSPSPPTTPPAAPRGALASPSRRISTTATQCDEVRALASSASLQRFSHGPLFFTLTFPAGSVNGNGEWDDTYGNGAMYPTLGMHPPAARAHHHHPYAMPPPHQHQHHHQSGGIRLPQAPPMTAAMMPNPAPGTPYGSLPPSASVPALYGNQLRGTPVAPSADYFVRRGSVTPDMSGGIGPVRRHTVSTSSPGRMSVGGHQSGMQEMAWQHQHPVPLSEMSVTPAPALANIGSAGSTPRKLLNANGTPPPIVAPTSAGGSPNSAASAGASVNAPTPAVAPTERTAVTA